MWLAEGRTGHECVSPAPFAIEMAKASDVPFWAPWASSTTSCASPCCQTNAPGLQRIVRAAAVNTMEGLRDVVEGDVRNSATEPWRAEHASSKVCVGKRGGGGGLVIDKVN